MNLQSRETLGTNKKLKMLCALKVALVVLTEYCESLIKVNVAGIFISGSLCVIKAGICNIKPCASSTARLNAISLQSFILRFEEKINNL